MSLAVLSPADRRASWTGELHRRDRLLTGAGLFLLLALVPLGAAAALDTRLLAGVPIWDKPMRFAFALGIHS